jgi:hypothetical protein
MNRKISISNYDESGKITGHSCWDDGDVLVRPDGLPLGNGIKLTELNDVDFSSVGGKALFVKNNEQELEFKDLTQFNFAPTVVVGSVDAGDILGNSSDAEFLHENSEVIGVAAANDGLAKAVSLVNNIGFGCIYLRRGEYRTNMSWGIIGKTDEIKITGEGPYNTVIDFDIIDPVTDYAISLSSSRLVLENLTIRGPKDFDSEITSIIKAGFGEVILRNVVIIPESTALYENYIVNFTSVMKLVLDNVIVDPDMIHESSSVLIKNCEIVHINKSYFFSGSDTDYAVVVETGVNKMFRFNSNSISSNGYSLKITGRNSSNSFFDRNELLGSVLINNFESIRDFRFEKNNITHWLDTGLAVLADANCNAVVASVTNNVINGKVDISPMTGVFCEGLEGFEVSDNKCFSPAAWTTGKSFRLIDNKNCDFSGNKAIRLAGGYGFDIDGNEDCIFDKCAVDGKEFFTRICFFISGVTKMCSFNGCRIKINGDESYGFLFDLLNGTPEDNSIDDNFITIDGNITCGIDAGSTTGRCTRNIIKVVESANDIVNSGNMLAKDNTKLII